MTTLNTPALYLNYNSSSSPEESKSTSTFYFTLRFSVVQRGNTCYASAMVIWTEEPVKCWRKACLMAFLDHTMLLQIMAMLSRTSRAYDKYRWVVKITNLKS